jgi:predicted nucleic acid-binding protein
MISVSGWPICGAASIQTSILSFDLQRLLRRLRRTGSGASLRHRPDQALPFVGAALRPGAELMLDTTVYIDALQNRSPAEVDLLLGMLICNHSAVCLAELTHAFGRLDPAHPATAATLRAIEAVVAAVPTHRLRAPGVTVWGGAGALAGLVFRLVGYPPGRERALLNDALVFLQALEDGHTVLTRNVGDFDLMSQLVPEGRILLYR